MPIWNPWHGCKKISPGCMNCYVYRRDAEFGKDSSIVTKTADFNLPLKKNRQKEYKLQLEEEPVYTCMTSDFFIDEADEWRPEIWKMIRERADLHFVIITKRIDRFMECIPEDWGDGYENVTIMCTCEDQKRADYRLPVFLHLPIRHRQIIHEPMLEQINIEKYLKEFPGEIEQVTCGGESGENARICEYDWILNTRQQCLKYNIDFYFKQTGAVFKKDGKIYHVPRKNQLEQAKKAGINYTKVKKDITESDLKKARNSMFEADLRRQETRFDALFIRLSHSDFRSRFHLRSADVQYIQEKGMDIIRSHARDFVRMRLAPAVIPNDGKQTPMRGHPVFLAQHATGCCCRGCLYKWHQIPAGTELTEEQQEYVVDILMEWIRRQMEDKKIQ